VEYLRAAHSGVRARGGPSRFGRDVSRPLNGTRTVQRVLRHRTRDVLLESMGYLRPAAWRRGLDRTAGKKELQQEAVILPFPARTREQPCRIQV
jgi:hypothetical protein